MKKSHLSIILILGMFGSYHIWKANTSIDIPNEKIVFEQVDKRKLSNFLNLVEKLNNKYQEQEEVEDSLSTIMSASKKLTTKTEMQSHAKNISFPFPWGMMIALWGSLAGAVLLLTRFNQIKTRAASSLSEKNKKQFFSSEKLPGDLNQVVIDTNKKISFQAQQIDRYIDLDLKEDITDCFIEKRRLEKIVQSFMNASFYLIKNDDTSRGMIIQTSEIEGRYKLNCFLDNFDQDHLSHQKLPELLRNFSILEKQFSGFKPSIDFHYVNNKDFNGLDIELTFENISELERGAVRSFQV